MIESLVIRPYNASDEERWLKCRLISFHDSAYYDDVYTKKPIFNNPSLELVAELNGEIIGIIDLEKDNKDGSICYCKSGVGAMIWTIAVLPDYRRHRIGNQLVLKAMSWSRNNGVNFIEAWTRDDEWVLDWYESLEFDRFHFYWHIYFKGENTKLLFECNDKDISPQAVFAHSDKDPKTLNQNKIDRFYKCSGYKLEITN